MKIDIGKFNVKSGKIVIGDPYHSHLVDAKINIFQVKKGRWNCRIRKSIDGVISELVILHKDINFELDDSEFYWEPTDNTVEIDSEVAGIFDVKYFYDEEIIPKKQTAPIIENNTWVNYCLFKTLETPNASSIPHGVVSTVNTRNDFYNIYVVTTKEFDIIGLKIQFLEEYEESIPILESESY